jgi:hypothetical protein
VRRAELFLAKRETRSAVFSLQTALRHDADHLEAHRLAALMFEEFGSPEALLHRGRLTELQPQLLQAKLEFARSALKFSKTETAVRILASVPEEDRKTSDFLKLQAELFLSSGRVAEAAAGYQRLLARDSKDQEALVKLAVLNLQASSQHEHASAYATLKSFVSDEQFGLIALRALIAEALKRQDLQAALSWSERISEMPAANFADALSRLHALFLARSSEYEGFLSTLEQKAAGEPRFAYQLGQWKVAVLGDEKAIAWLERKNREIYPALSPCLWATAIARLTAGWTSSPSSGGVIGVNWSLCGLPFSPEPTPSRTI